MMIVFLVYRCFRKIKQDIYRDKRDLKKVLFAKSFKNIEYKANNSECGNIRVFVYVPTPPPS